MKNACPIALFFLLIVAFSPSLNAQSLNGNCGTQLVSEAAELADPSLRIARERFDSLMMEKVYLHPTPIAGEAARIPATLYTIPVVFHIIHNNGPENVSDSIIYEALNTMNDGFAHRNFFDSIVGVDVQIEFCLATQDEYGDSTSGITRDVSSHTVLNYINFGDSIYRINKWDGTKYLNIYILTSICNVTPNSPTCYSGLGWYPSNHGNLQDGIFAIASSISYPNSTLMAHEGGHYLGLYHTFTAGCNNSDCRLNGDQVCDTPPDNLPGPWMGCDTANNSCSSDTVDLGIWNPYRPVSLGGLGDQLDKERNFMDYSGCQYEFTQGQKDRMITALTTTRSSLLSSRGCLPGCTLPITANFSLSDSVILAGDTVFFTNSTTGASQYTWYLNGSPFSTSQDTSLQFNTQGTYTITHCGENSDVSCKECISKTVVVSCPVNSSFLASDTVLSSLDTLFLTNQSNGGVTYEWWINGNLVSFAQDTHFVFTQGGIQNIVLAVSNGTCTDSSDVFSVQVNCSGQATFQVIGDSYIGPGGQLHLDNLSSGALTYEWFLDSVSLGFGNDTLLSIPNAFAGKVWLQSYNGFCYDSSETQTYIQVADCNFREANDWYFGTASHVDFDSVPPVQLWPGTATEWFNNTGASDVTGQTNFYTKAGIIFDRENVGMLNGSFIPSFNSYYQPYLAFRKPGSAHEYFLAHTTHSFGNFYLYYSLIDMTGDDGKGEVVLKNQLVETNTQTGFGVVSHANGRDYWVVSHSSLSPPVMQAWLVTDTGFSANPVISPLSTWLGASGFGEFRFSPDGKRIATGTSGLANIYLFDFAPSTGQASYGGALTTASSGAVSLCFSPGSSKLYYSNRTDKQCFQFDLTRQSLADINASRVLVATTNNLYLTGLQNGSDGNLYLGNGNRYLGVFREPDAYGLDALYDSLGIDLNGQYPGWSLPAFPASHFRAKEAIVWGKDSLCGLSSNVRFEACNIYGQDSVWWEGIGSANLLIDSVTTARFDFGSNGFAGVVVHKMNACGIFSDTLNVFLSPSPDGGLPPDTLICNADSFLIQAAPNLSSYLWPDASTADSFWADSVGTFVLQITDAAGCMGLDSMAILGLSSTPASIQLPADSAVCPNASLPLSLPNGLGSYLWQNGDTASSTTFTGPGTYWAEVTDNCGRQVADTIVYQLLPLPNLDLGADTTLCQGQSLVLDAGANFTSYSWNTLATTQSIVANSAGLFSVGAHDVCNRLQFASIQVDYATLMSIDLGNDSTVCLGQTINLDAGPGFVTYLWQNGSTNQSINTNQIGWQIVDATDSCGILVVDSFLLTNFPVNPPDLGADQVLCSGASLNLSPNLNNFTNFNWSDGSNGNSFLANSTGWVWLEALDSCGLLLRDSVLVMTDSLSAPNLGPDTSLCPGQNILLDAGANYNSYLWQDGSTGQLLVASNPGVYIVQANSPAGCSYQDSLEIDLCVGLSAQIPGSELGIFPNPNAGTFRLRVALPGMAGDGQVCIYDALGRKVMDLQLPMAGPGLWEQDLELRTAGVYVLEFSLGKQRMRGRIVIH